MGEKKDLRQSMKKRLRLLPAGTRGILSASIANKLSSLPEWKQSGMIGMTMSTDDEIDTKPLIRTAWAKNKKIAVPKTDPNQKIMDFRRIVSLTQVEEAFAGILEPKTAETESVLPEEIDLLVVPGLVFDHNGFRIGFGGGFYDRYLSEYRNVTVSLAYEMQLLDRIPVEVFDLPVDIIVTERRVIRTGKVQ
ncbi:MAG TPA: 5-formyltetrahydrofolate cyclo-ligase [Bacillales bacterium]|nr:5-formyltetrahydrofolate cyclo-ligase [Bacillales bacterium]